MKVSVKMETKARRTIIRTTVLRGESFLSTRIQIAILKDIIPLP